MFTLVRRSPFEWMEQMERRVDGMLGRFFEQNGARGTTWTPASEAYVRNGNLVVRCDLPGVDPGDVHVEVTGRTLVISGERKPAEQIPDEDYWWRGIPYGSFECTVALPENIDANAVKATCHNGVLTLEVPLAKELTKQTVPITVEQPALAA
jgi:HSP20 family protein